MTGANVDVGCRAQVEITSRIVSYRKTKVERSAGLQDRVTTRGQTGGQTDGHDRSHYLSYYCCRENVVISTWKT